MRGKEKRWREEGGRERDHEGSRADFTEGNGLDIVRDETTDEFDMSLL